MKNKYLDKVTNCLFFLALALIVYMPLHVFIAQSASLVTGGLEVWKATKDVLIVLLVPGMLFWAYKRGLFADSFLRKFIIFSGLYTLLHFLFLLFYRDITGTYAAIIACVYNTRIFGYLLLGYLVVSSTSAKKHSKTILTAGLLVALIVALFGVFQYFLPHDLLESVGYSLERGVKPNFFIDDKPDFPRVMSTIKDPNSLGAFLIIPILLTGVSLLNNKFNKELFIRPFRKSFLVFVLSVLLICLFLTFSRGATLALIVSLAVFFALYNSDKLINTTKRYWPHASIVLVVTLGVVFMFRDTYIFKNVVFHADEATTKADPNEQRLILYERATENILDQPLGHGPGSAGIVSEKSDSGENLTENYFLQVAHETGVVGLILFLLITTLLIRYLYYDYILHKHMLSLIVLASLAGYLFYGLLVHIWSNEAVALQWWLLAGLALGVNISKR